MPLTTLPYDDEQAGPLNIALSGQLTCQCPVNGLQDFATVEVRYQPGAALLELGSFAAYLASFAGLAVTHEALTSQIHRALNEAVWPSRLVVTTTWAPIEGIDCTITAGEQP
jgi:NADPH-dependent 7-cyano-7-deazaguanine reductase QueF